MGYYSIIAQCGGCARTFSANPERVPCYPVNLDRAPGPPNFRLDQHGTKEPFCEDCFNAVQAIRDEAGLPRQTPMANAWGASEVLG